MDDLVGPKRTTDGAFHYEPVLTNSCSRARVDPSVAIWTYAHSATPGPVFMCRPRLHEVGAFIRASPALVWAKGSDPVGALAPLAPSSHRPRASRSRRSAASLGARRNSDALHSRSTRGRFAHRRSPGG